MVSARPDPVHLQAAEKVDLPRSDGTAEQIYGSLTFDLQRCAFYHGMRARFFDSFGKAGLLLSFVSGAGVFTTLLQSGGARSLATTLAALTAFFSGLNMIVGFSRKARDHEVLRSKYYALRIDVEKARRRPQA
jgi:hypothetical protein